MKPIEHRLGQIFIETRRVWGGRGDERAELQTEGHDGDSLLSSTDVSIRQQYRTTFCALKHTCSSYNQVVYLGSGSWLDSSSGVHEGEGMALAVGGGKARGENSRVKLEGVTKADIQK